MKSKPPCVTVIPWLRANLGQRSIAPLTGTDMKALAAAVQIIELWSYHHEPGVLEAFGRIVRCMQPTTRELAFHAIAHVMDWTDRGTIWLAAGLPDFAPSRCSNEPVSDAWLSFHGHEGGAE